MEGGRDVDIKMDCRQETKERTWKGGKRRRIEGKGGMQGRKKKEFRRTGLICRRKNFNKEQKYINWIKTKKDSSELFCR
jgi:hypothetical protein